VAGLATGLVGGGIAVALRGTPYGLWAGDGDYAWILFWVNRMSAHQPVPDYYPPLYLDLLRVWSYWSGQPPVYVVKPVQLVGTALFGGRVPVQRLVLRPPGRWASAWWRRSVRQPVKPYSQVTLVVLVPF
jgi:galactan 5-O-arabinofuranosyltransferase